MARIIEAVEAESVAAPTTGPRTRGGVVSFAARDIAERIDAKALIAFATSGDTVRRMARLHTALPVLAFTPRDEVRNQLALTWGVRTFVTPQVSTRGPSRMPSCPCSGRRADSAASPVGP